MLFFLHNASHQCIIYSHSKKVHLHCTYMLRFLMWLEELCFLEALADLLPKVGRHFRWTYFVKESFGKRLAMTSFSCYFPATTYLVIPPFPTSQSLLFTILTSSYMTNDFFYDRGWSRSGQSCSQEGI